MPLENHQAADELTLLAERYRMDPGRPHGTHAAELFERVVTEGRWW